MMRLVEPSKDWEDGFLELARDWQDHDNDRYRLTRENFDGYLQRIERASRADEVPTGFVPGTEYWLVDGGCRIVSCVRLRFSLNPALEEEGGHIGYDVRPSFRRRGFGMTEAAGRRHFFVGSSLGKAPSVCPSLVNSKALVRPLTLGVARRALPTKPFNLLVVPAGGLRCEDNKVALLAQDALASVPWGNNSPIS